ncbi:MAG: hypothetical protein UFG06_14030 [Lachnospiraceae bacterium]|nr:hypothetical protein [Lachnospiraceae bacterium]
MVKPGLKAGDVFEDGGLNYEVLSVNTDGTYTSKRTEKKAEMLDTQEITPTEKEAVEKAVKRSQTTARRNSTRKK